MLCVKNSEMFLLGGKPIVHNINMINSPTSLKQPSTSEVFSSLSPPARPIASARFEAQPAHLCKLRQWLADCLTEQRCYRRSLIDDVVLAVNEACMNIIQHAYCYAGGRSFEVAIAATDTELIVRIADSAPRLDPACVKGRELDDIRPGGLGVYFINELMDEVQYLDCPRPQGNILQLVKKCRR